MPYSNFTVQKKVYTSTGASSKFPEELQVFVQALGIRNNSSNPVEVFIDKYSTSSVVVPANSYKEVAVSTDWFTVVFGATSVAGDKVEVSYVVMDDMGLLVPKFPNLIQNTVVGDIQYNPINAGMYTATPFATSDGANSIMANENIIKIEYYLNGLVTDTSSADFYKDYFNMIQTFVQSLYPTGYVPPVNPAYNPAATTQLIEQLKAAFESKGLPLNDEFYGGWASLLEYDKALARSVFGLDAVTVPRIAFPYTIIGFSLKNTGSTPATVVVTNDDNQTYTLTIPALQTVDIPTDIYNNTVVPTASTVTNNNYDLQKLEVTAGTIELSFTGFSVKMIGFAPIINIVYPLGFDEASGKPATQYTSFVNSLNAFKQQLIGAKFTGRVIYFKQIPFASQPSPVWDSEYIIPQIFDSPYTLIWERVRPYVHNMVYSRSQVEEHVLRIIAWENKTLFYGSGNPSPKTLDEVINNHSVDKFLWNDLSSITNVLDRKNAKIKILEDWLLREYNSPYAMGGLNFFFIRG